MNRVYSSAVGNRPTISRYTRRKNSSSLHKPLRGNPKLLQLGIDQRIDVIVFRRFREREFQILRQHDEVRADRDRAEPRRNERLATLRRR